VSTSAIILLKTIPVAEACPGRWWTPKVEDLAAIEPGSTHVKLLAVEPDADGGADLWDAHSVWVAVEDRDADELIGTIVQTSLDRDGYRVGDQLTGPVDRVFDIVSFGPDGRPLLNEQRTQFAVGKRALVGITVVSHDEQLVERQQFVGTIAAADAHHGIRLSLDDGSDYWLPPDTRSLEEARPGEYSLHSNGQTVVDPDYVCTWTITRPERPHAMPNDGYHAG
jgi:hypothetical protein